MSLMRFRLVPVVVVLCVIIVGLVLMALHRPVTVGMGLFVLGLVLLYPVGRWARRTRVASDSSLTE